MHQDYPSIFKTKENCKNVYVKTTKNAYMYILSVILYITAYLFSYDCALCVGVFTIDVYFISQITVIASLSYLSKTEYVSC